MSKPTEESISSRISDVHSDLGSVLDSLETLITLLEAKAGGEDIEGYAAGIAQLLKGPRGVVSKAFNDLDRIESDIVRGQEAVTP